MKDQILTAKFPGEFRDEVISINFTCARGYDDVNDAAAIIARIGDNPARDVEFTMNEDDGREYQYTEHGEDAVGIVMAYFNDDLRQEVLRRAAMATVTGDGDRWIRNTSYWDPEWKDTGDDYF